MTRQNYAPYLASHAATNENTSSEVSREELRQAADILNNLQKF
jgi:integrase